MLGVNSLVEILIIFLASFYIWYFLARSMVMEWFRNWITGYQNLSLADAIGEMYRDFISSLNGEKIKRAKLQYLRYWISEFLDCPWCSGAWIALSLSLISGMVGWVHTPWLLLWLASATLVGLIGKYQGE